MPFLAVVDLALASLHRPIGGPTMSPWWVHHLGPAPLPKLAELLHDLYWPSAPRTSALYFLGAVHRSGKNALCGVALNLAGHVDAPHQSNYPRCSGNLPWGGVEGLLGVASWLGAGGLWRSCSRNRMAGALGAAVGLGCAGPGPGFCLPFAPPAHTSSFGSACGSRSPPRPVHVSSSFSSVGDAGPGWDAGRTFRSAAFPTIFGVSWHPGPRCWCVLARLYLGLTHARHRARLRLASHDGCLAKKSHRWSRFGGAAGFW